MALLLVEDNPVAKGDLRENGHSQEQHVQVLGQMLGIHEFQDDEFFTVNKWALISLWFRVRII